MRCTSSCRWYESENEASVQQEEGKCSGRSREAKQRTSSCIVAFSWPTPSLQLLVEAIDAIGAAKVDRCTFLSILTRCYLRYSEAVPSFSRMPTAARYAEHNLPCTFVSELRWATRLKLKSALDWHSNDRNWQALAAEMGYSTQEVMTFGLESQRREGSPTIAMLHDWGTKNKRVDELIRLLEIIDNQEAVEAILSSSSTCA